MTSNLESPVATVRETLPDHLIPLPGDTIGRWALWRTVCLRGAGFPAAEVLRIADRECAAAADRLNAVEAESERLREAALEALRRELEASGKDRLDLLIKAIRKVKRGNPPATAGLAAETVAAIEAWQAAAGRLATEKGSYKAAYAAAEERLEREIREVAQDDHFREAMMWQNRHAAETGLSSFLRRPAGSGRGSARDRGHLQMIASYLQRYCTKNDTIGFFGPVGWATLTESGTPAGVRVGEDLVASRQVFFEGWAIDALADHLAEDEEMRPWLSPRLSPFLRREGTVYITPDGNRIECGPLSASLLAGCDGTRPAIELMRGLGQIPPEAATFLWNMLADFHAKGALRWGFQVPLSSYPERSLREQLERIDNEPLRDRSLALLDEIVQKRDAVERAGNPDELESAFRDLEASFTRITGRETFRGEGQIYAGRTLLYEDCRRDLDLELGAPFLEQMAPALSMVLTSARWFTHHVATGMRELFARIYEQMSPQTGPVIDFLAFSREALPRLFNRENHQERQSELYGRWARVLRVPPGERRVSYRSEDLRPLVEEIFAAPTVGWQKARCHSPDMLVSSPSMEAFRQGDFQVVLGEVHLAINSLDRNLFFSQHPNPAELHKAIDSDLPLPSLIPLFAKRWNQEAASVNLGLWAPTVNGRMDVALRSPKDYYLDLSTDPAQAPRSQVISIAELVIEPENGQLFVRPRDGRVRFEAVEFYQFVLMMQAIETFRVMPASRYTPRITIDQVVVTRESWMFPASELRFMEAPTAEERYAATRRWADELGLPRFLFAKSAIEGKPMYLDLESPVLVEIFAKIVRQTIAYAEDPPIHLSEMLPDHDQLWLPDAQDNRYTCELRMVVIDQN